VPRITQNLQFVAMKSVPPIREQMEKTVTAAIVSNATVSARDCDLDAESFEYVGSVAAFNVVTPPVRALQPIHQRRNKKEGGTVPSGVALVFSIRIYFLAGEVLSRKSTNSFAPDGTAAPPSTIAVALIALPYSALFASSSESIDAPASDTPANSPFARE